jgi:hypothetical protein
MSIRVYTFDEFQRATFSPTPPSANIFEEDGGYASVSVTGKVGPQNVMNVNDFALASRMQQDIYTMGDVGDSKERMFFAFIDSGHFVTEERLTKELLEATLRLRIDSLLIDMDLFPPDVRKQLRPQDYLEKILSHPLRRGTVNIANIQHDGWCDFLSKKGVCNCNPDVAITEVQNVAPHS